MAVKSLPPGWEVDRIDKYDARRFVIRDEQGVAVVPGQETETIPLEASMFYAWWCYLVGRPYIGPPSYLEWSWNQKLRIQGCDKCGRAYP